jgi:hypothetical protein
LNTAFSSRIVSSTVLKSMILSALPADGAVSKVKRSLPVPPVSVSRPAPP